MLLALGLIGLTGITNSIERRVDEHKRALVPGFTTRYNITRLVYYETYQDVTEAIAREKQIKSWRRRKKLDLIVSMNPRWEDLAGDWYNEPADRTGVRPLAALGVTGGLTAPGGQA